jgi:general secretion pathway protein G
MECTISKGHARVSRARRLQTRGGGFTLIELMVVLLILALLTSIAAPRVTKHLSKAKAQTAKIQVDALSGAIDAFALDIGRPPTASEGMQALLAKPADLPSWDGPYIKKSASLVDPWGRPYLYRNPGIHGGDYDVYTLGSDSKEGGEGDAADVGNW